MVSLAREDVSQIRSYLEREELARIRRVLGQVALFEGLPGDTLDALTRRVGVQRVPGGNVVLNGEHAGRGLHVIMAGRAKVVLSGENGREVTLAVLRPDAIFGELALLGVEERSVQVVALEPVTALLIPRQEIFTILREHPAVAVRFLEEMAKRRRRSDETVAELALCDVKARLVRCLIHLAEEDDAAVAEGLLVKRRPTQQDLANMVGSCRETVSRMFNQLVREGLLATQGRALLVRSELIASHRANAPGAAAAG